METSDNRQFGRKRPEKQRILIWIAGILAGVAGGYLYYIKIGCNSGGCPITSNPYMTMLWGGVMGYLLADMIPYRKKQNP